jgi:signal transduction histidine kinase
MLAIILFLTLVFVVVRWRLTIVRRQELQLINTVEGRTAELRHANASLLQEIEERKRAEADAYRANATKSEFLAHLSHEIRTPMNAILGFTEILNDKVTDTQHRKYLRSIELSGNNLLRLINDILDLSKIEAGRLDLQLATVDLRHLLFELEQLFEFQFRKKNLHFELKYDERIPRTLYLDELRMRQILFNLVGNAVKYTDKGSVAVEAVLLLRRGNSCSIAIAVRDTGMGIPPSQLTAIFEPFRQVGSTRTAEARGTGLGLAITKRLLDIMGGSIEVESRLGQGSVFRLVLPDLRFPDDLLFEEAGNPEATVSVPVSKTSAEKSNDPDAASALVPPATGDREALRILLETLESRHLPLWQQVSRSYHIQEIEQLAEEVLVAAERAAFHPLIDWSRRLLSEAGDFDMDNVPRTLHEFAEHLQFLREQCQQA